MAGQGGMKSRSVAEFWEQYNFFIIWYQWKSFIEVMNWSSLRIPSKKKKFSKWSQNDITRPTEVVWNHGLSSVKNELVTQEPATSASVNKVVESEFSRTSSLDLYMIISIWKPPLIVATSFVSKVFDKAHCIYILFLCIEVDQLRLLEFDLDSNIHSDPSLFAENASS